jgi:cell division septum initiation protein DivIVA
MTTKHITDQGVHGSDAAVDPVHPDSAQQAEDASRQLLAKARYDAFRLMTEARDEAETILDEARAEAGGTKKAAELTMESMAEKADSDAAAIIESAREEAATIVASAHRTAGEQRMVEEKDELEAEHQALSDRVSTLRTLADQLEDRFAALAAPSTENAASEAQARDATTTEDSPTPGVSSPTIDYSPSVEHPTDDEKNAEPEVTVERDSFYNRRSANLPRIGEEGGRSAFDMTRSMRKLMETD